MKRPRPVRRVGSGHHQPAGQGNPTRSPGQSRPGGAALRGGAMRIRKRTPASAASQGPPPAPPPPPLLPLQQPMEKQRQKENKETEEEEEEKRAILAAGEDDDRVRPAAAAAAAIASANRNSRASAADDVPKPEPQEQDASATAVRCSRNDGKRWRCKRASVPGYQFCDRHIAWSTRKRKPRASKKPSKSRGGGVLEPTSIPKKFAEDHGETQRDAGFLGGF